MDVFNTVAICLHQVHIITIYIHRTVRSYRNYDKNRATVQDKLEHEISFIEAFLDIYFDGDDTLFEQAEVRDGLRQDISRVLQSLRKILMEYQDDAIRQDVVTREDLILQHTHDPNPPPTTVTPSTRFRRVVRSRVIKKIEGKLNNLKDRTPPRIEWALYTEKRIAELLVEYRNWTTLLREDLALLGTLGIHPSPSATNVADLKLQSLFEKQKKISRDVPEDFVGLAGDLVSSDDSDGRLVFTAIYQDQFGLGRENILAEVRNYPQELRALVQDEDADESERIASLKMPLRELAWLLNESLDQWKQRRDAGDAEDGQDGLIEQPSCLGFLDQPDASRMLLLYRLPAPGLENNSLVLTLFDRLEQRDASRRPIRPALGTRFLIAYRLASAVLGVFASGWLHKSIRSRAILISDSNKPFLIGWGVARREEDATILNSADELDLVPNLYRHPDRYGKPKVRATQEHDIYSLGVVLLELGLWETMEGKFSKIINGSRRSGELPSARSVAKAIFEMALGEKSTQEMEVGYAEIIRKCLKGSFNISENEGSSTQLPIAFRNEVNKKLELGSTL